MPEWMWWFLYACFLIVAVQLDGHRRALRRIDAKLDAALRRLGGEAASVEAELRRSDDAAEAENRRLVKRSLPLGVLLLVAGGAAGAVAGWLASPDRALAAGAVGAFAGFALGTFLHGFREGLHG